MSFKITSILEVSLVLLISCVLLVSADGVKQPSVDQIVSPPVTDCLECICEAVSGCNRTETCHGDVCGPFKITWAYWADAGKPTLQDEDEKSPTAYVNCANDPYCATRSVQNYIAKFEQDCNGDGVINCYDHAAIHKLGEFGCSGDIGLLYGIKLQQCLNVKFLMHTTERTVPDQMVSPSLTEDCLGCICEAISGCNTTKICHGDVCGLFRITWAYWSNAGKPTLQDEDEKSPTAYVNCANDPYCAARSVQNFMAKFGQDCNGDGVINCYDHAAIHKLGEFGCSGDIGLAYGTKLQQCLKEVGSL